MIATGMSFSATEAAWIRGSILLLCVSALIVGRLRSKKNDNGEQAYRQNTKEIIRREIWNN
jgi:hypothetical protein